MRDSGTVKTLRKARKLIEREEGWTQYDFQVTTKTSWFRRLFHAEEFAYCALGALKKIDGPYEGDAIRFLRKAALAVGFHHETTLNDVAGHKATLQMFDDAIALAEGE